MVGVKKIGFFGGSFDPIHYGHIHIAIQAKERLGLSEVFFSPTYISPFKQEKENSTDSLHRLHMVREAIKDIPNFHTWDLEVREKKISYTVDALHLFIPKMKEKFGAVEIFLILAADLVGDFFLWKKPEEILQLVSIAIGARSSYTIEELCKHIPEKYQKLFIKSFFTMPTLDISSTLIRERLAKDLYCAHLMPREVLDYIAIHKLYYHSEIKN